MPSAFRRSGGTNRKRTSPSGIPGASFSSPSPPSSSGRASASFRPLRGVKPWQGGTYLTSVGLSDLDSILGGGQLLGTSIVIEEDRLWGDLAITLVKYWCAEAISQGQHLLIPTFSKPSHADAPDKGDENDSLSFLFGDQWFEDEEQPWRNRENELHDLLSALPRNLHWDKQKKKEDKAKRDQEAADAADAADIGSGIGRISLGPMAILEEDEEDEEQKADDGLEVAWQYKKSVQQERLAQSKSNSTIASIVTDVFCHSYDLSARMTDQNPLDASSYLHEVPLLPTGSRSESDSYALGHKLFYELVRLLKERTASDSDKAIRLLLYHLPMEVIAVGIPLFVAHIRKHSLPVVIMVLHAPTTDVKSKIRLGRSCDVVLSTEGFASRKEHPPPPEFRHLLGVLKVARTTRKRTEVAASIYGFKRDRRKLHIPLLHIPPEDYAEGGGSTGGVRSGAGRPSKPEAGGSSSAVRKPSSGGGMGCSSNMSGSPLDF